MSMIALFYSLALALFVAGLSVAARRLRVASPILMLIAGMALSFAPGLHPFALEPEVVLLLFLPPLLYIAGVGMSWRGFRANLRPILLLAVGCVIFTSAVVAALAHYAFGLPLAVGFVLGAIVSPPDAVAPMAIAKHLGVPQRILTILEGESLVNDATALTIFSFAIAAVGAGQFSFVDAVLRFIVIVAGELAYGILVGRIMLWLRFKANDPRAEVLLALTTPFLAFWPPHALGASGVIACVATGLWVSWNGPKVIRPATRLQGYFIWDLIAWAIEALVFLLTGLEARAVFERLGDDSWARAFEVALAVSAAVIVVRFVWVFPATYLTRLIPAVRRVDPFPNWRAPFLVAFTGLRGVVSLAAALSVPLEIDGRPFPGRDLVLFSTFVVIVVTLLGQGTLLPLVIRALGLTRTGQDEAHANKRDERAARMAGLDAVLAETEAICAKGASPVAIAAVHRRHADRRAQLTTTLDETTPDDPATEAIVLELRLVDAERTAIASAFEANRLTDEARRRIERELDLEEARLRHQLASLGPRAGEGGH